MITNFALSLSSDGIELLHRVPRGWRRVGQAEVDSETLAADLSALREKAVIIEPDGLRTKLIIPLDQIKYVAIDSTMTTDDDIHAALDGATPYALDDLVIDSERFGGRTHIAAVARETLQEAESFAAAHGFQPVAFVAVPEPFTFQKEVFFGPTEMARDIVGPDALIDRDELPVMVVGTRIKSRLLVFDLPEDVQEEVYKDDLANLLATVGNGPKPDEEATELAKAEDEVVAHQDATALATPVLIDRIPAEYFAPKPDKVVVPEQPRFVPQNPVFAALPLFDPIIAEVRLPAPKKAKAPLTAIFGRSENNAPKLAPVVSIIPEQRLPQPAEQTQSTNKTPVIAGLGIAAAIALFAGVIWTQQDQPVTPTEVTEPRVVVADAVPEPAPVVEEVATAPAVAVVAVPEPEPVLEAGLNIPPLQVAGLPAPASPSLSAPNFGTIAPVRQLFAIGELQVASADTATFTIQPPPAPPEPDAALAEVGTPILRGRVLSPDEAARIYAATGVWLRAPRFLDVPSGAIPLNFRPPSATTPPDRILQPTTAPLEGLDTDLSFVAPANPPAPEIIFPRDENGFILATKEGTVTPEGAFVIAGLPDLAITPRPELSQAERDRMALLAPAPEGVILVAGRPDVVPPLRPADASLPEAVVEPPQDDVETATALANPADAAQPETLTPGSVGIAGLELQNSGTIALNTAVVEGNAIVDLRPRLRPQGLASVTATSAPDITDIISNIATDDATLRFDNSTALAVVLSLRPDERPANFGNVVAAALARQQTVPVAPTAPIAAAAPVPPQNFEPVPGGVARAATQEDAIRLRDINLIGVYGRPNARRALVRLSNGRYVRVEVGSALDGGQVTAIGENALNYVKRGRTYALELP